MPDAAPCTHSARPLARGACGAAHRTPPTSPSATAPGSPSPGRRRASASPTSRTACSRSGSRKGDAFGILASTRLEWVLFDYALALVGAVTVPVYATSSPHDCAYALDHADAIGVLAEDDEQIAKLDEVKADIGRVEHILTFADLDDLAARGREFAAVRPRRPRPRDRSDRRGRPVHLHLHLGHDRLAEGVHDPPPERVRDGGLGRRGDRADRGRATSSCSGCRSRTTSDGSSTSPGANDRLHDGVLLRSDPGRRSAPSRPAAPAARRPAHLREGPRRHAFRLRRAERREAQAGRLGARRRPPCRGSAERPASRCRRSSRSSTASPTGSSTRSSRSASAAGSGSRPPGAAPLSVEIAEFFHSLDVLILEGYGLTECTSRRDREPPQPVPVRDGRPRAAPASSCGSRTTASCSSASGDRLRGLLQGRGGDARGRSTRTGWLHTGDVAEIDGDGFVRITDRKKDIIVTAGGKKVAPQNLENQLKTSKFVSQALVVGDRRPYIGALVALDPRPRSKPPACQATRRPRRARPGHRRRREPGPDGLRADQAVRRPPA